MNCHKVVTSSLNARQEEAELAEAEGREPEVIISDELAKLYSALALGEDLTYSSALERKPIEWVRVHNLPDFVYFDHRPHVARDIACETCHGPVQGMERMRQESDLSMGWCLDCHRSNAATKTGGMLQAGEDRVADHVSTNCVTCHF
jgi:hypothetical protein